MVPLITDKKIVDDLFGRYVESVYPSPDEARDVLSSGKKLLFYLGIDATGPDIHIGHGTNLLWLKKLQKFGHDVVILIGDFTARIGDPTDKEAARKALSEEEVESNMKTYVEQVSRILPKGSFSIRRNSEWLDKMTFKEVIKLTSHFTVQQMIVRDMFQKRLENQKPIYLHEFLYPVMQGYDSVAMRVDGEVGGNDQTFNMLAGRDLAKSLLGKNKLVVTTRLLEDPDTGKKIMNKSEGNVISLNDEPQEIRRKVLTLDDRMVRTVFELCTEKDLGWISERRAAVSAGESPRQFKEELADELVSMLYGGEAVDDAHQAKKISAAGMKLLDLLVLKKAGLATSKSNAKDLLKQGAVTVNGGPADDWNIEVKKGDKIRVGKGKFIEIE